MITIFTTPSCSSCRKAKKWLDDNKLKYDEINIFNTKLTRKDIVAILDKTENGFDDIISRRSKIISESNININDMKINELLDFIIENPSILRRPIIIDHKRLQVGYNDEEIRTFLPRHVRDQLICNERVCTGEYVCDYLQSLQNILRIKT